MHTAILLAAIVNQNRLPGKAMTIDQAKGLIESNWKTRDPAETAKRKKAYKAKAREKVKRQVREAGKQVEAIVKERRGNNKHRQAECNGSS